MEVAVYAVGQLARQAIAGQALSHTCAAIAFVEVLAPTAISQGDAILLALLRKILHPLPSPPQR